MPKVILELPEMPENCWECPLQAISTEKKIRYCTVIRYSTDYYGTKRRDDCPLKKEELKRWIKCMKYHLKRIESSPKMPIERWTGDEREIICPACKSYICYPEDIKTIDLKYRQFCGACGQKLNWESEVEHDG
jgi:uncharacterized CHY-type Zn-finger protein